MTSHEIAQWALEHDRDLPDFWHAPYGSAAIYIFFLGKIMEEGLLPLPFKDEGTFRQSVLVMMKALRGESTWTEELHYKGNLFQGMREGEGTVREMISALSGFGQIDSNLEYMCDFTIAIKGSELQIPQARLFPKEE